MSFGDHFNEQNVAKSIAINNCWPKRVTLKKLDERTKIQMKPPKEIGKLKERTIG